MVGRSGGRKRGAAAGVGDVRSRGRGTARFIVYPVGNGCWRWLFKVIPTGEVLAECMLAYSRRSDAIRGVARFRKLCAGADPVLALERMSQTAPAEVTR